MAVQLKVCGFTRAKDIEEAVAGGVGIIGLNFSRKSPRYVSPEQACGLLYGLPQGLKIIGVFVDPVEREVRGIYEKCGLSGVQFHGKENPALLSRFKERFPGAIVIKAVRVKNKSVLAENLKKYSPDFFLLDSHAQNAMGGTGKKLDLSILRGMDLPWHKIFLAGGITPENIREILRDFRPYGIDVASGVESSPGRKDMNKIRLLLKNIT